MTHPFTGPTNDPQAQPPPGAQPSEEELRAYLDQLRDADPGMLIAEAYNMLATGAQVKLGRPDARMLIDAMAAMTQAASASLPAEIASQMNQGVQQLQVAQVQAEATAAKQGEQEGAASADESAAAPGEAGGPSPPPSQPPGQRMTDRLWVPGRDPGPRAG